MSQNTDWLLIDVGTHPYQPIDDLEAIARFATFTDRPAAATALRSAAHKLARGGRRAKTTREDAAAIAAASDERCMAIQALIHEHYIELRPDPITEHRMGLHVTHKAATLLQKTVGCVCPLPASHAA
jgi:hypothetical protein